MTIQSMFSPAAWALALLLSLVSAPHAQAGEPMPVGLHPDFHFLATKTEYLDARKIESILNRNFYTRMPLEQVRYLRLQTFRHIEDLQALSEKAQGDLAPIEARQALLAKSQKILDIDKYLQDRQKVLQPGEDSRKIPKIPKAAKAARAPKKAWEFSLFKRTPSATNSAPKAKVEGVRRTQALQAGPQPAGAYSDVAQ